MTSQLWPDKRTDGGVTVAVRFAGSVPDLVGDVGRLVEAWEAEVFGSGHDLLDDLQRAPWVEATEDGVEVVFEGRSGNRMWKDWMVSMTSHVRASDADVKHIAFLDRVGGRVRSAVDWGPTQRAEALDSLKRSRLGIDPTTDLNGYLRRRLAEEGFLLSAGTGGGLAKEAFSLADEVAQDRTIHQVVRIRGSDPGDEWLPLVVLEAGADAAMNAGDNRRASEYRERASR